jgi:Domain of unknown function (DUF6895)
LTELLESQAKAEIQTTRSTPADLLVERALEWLEANLDYFEPFKGGIKVDDYAEKALVELALLCLCLHRQPRYATHPRTRRFLQFIADLYSTPLYRERLFRVQGAFVPHAVLIVTLDTCGYLEGDPLRERFQRFIEHSGVSYVEREPHRVLEVRHILDVARFRHHLPSYLALCRASIVGKPLNPIYMSDEDAYSLTHTLLYLSDFGSRPIPTLPLQRLHGLYWAVHHLLGMYVHQGNLDIAGELLLSCHALRGTTSELYALGWQALLAGQRPDGAVPGPAPEATDIDDGDADKRRERLFEHCYHTTLVATLVGALCPLPRGDHVPS